LLDCRILSLMVIRSSIVILHQVDMNMVDKDLSCLGKFLQFFYSEAHCLNAMRRKVQSGWIVMGRGHQFYHVQHNSFLLLILDSHLYWELDSLTLPHAPLPVPGLPMPA
jgi:hypothetical protein